MVKISLNASICKIKIRKYLQEATTSRLFLDMLEILIFIFIQTAM